MSGERYVLSLIVLAVLAVSVAAQDAPKTEFAADIRHYEGVEPPVIDGFLDDDAWQYPTQGRLANNYNGSWRVMFNPDLADDDPAQPGVVEGSDVPYAEEDCSFRVWTLYDAEYLYVAVSVNDEELVTRVGSDEEDGTTWYDDSCEIFIDGNHNRVSGNVNSHPEEYETGGQFVLTAANARRDAEAGNPTFGPGADAEWYGVAIDKADFTGFDYEFRIKLSKIGNPERGDVVGFNVAVNDADDPASDTNDYQLRWTGMAHQEDTYGDLVFGRRTLTAPLISGAVTIDGKMDEPDWAVADTQKGGIPYGPFEGTSMPRDLDDLSFDVYVMHDADYLYVALDVNDSEIFTDNESPGAEDGYTWYDDSAEIFIDGNHSHTPGNSGETGIGLGGQLVITANNAYRDANAAEVGEIFYGPADLDDWYALTTLTDDGYLAEFRVKKESVMTPADIETIGFEIAINEDDSEPDWEKDSGFQINWCGHPHNEASYGDLVFGPEAPVSVEGWELR